MVLQCIQLLLLSLWHLYSTEQCWPEMRKLPNKPRQVVATKLRFNSMLFITMDPGPPKAIISFLQP